jgi:transcriptional regulator with XRE-family HTH domain
LQRDPTSERVARNITRAREAQGFTLRGLSARMSELGRPILASGLLKLEQGGRRIDVDDLVALALALDVSPAQLLLGPVARDDELELTPGVNATGHQAWRWARGEVPFPPSEPIEQVLEDGRVVQVGDAESHVRWLRFYVENRPDHAWSAEAWVRAQAIGGEPGQVWNTFRDTLDEIASQGGPDDGLD